MTDSELTRLAFKAAFNGADINHDQDMLKRWSPLTDDGDALRLAVKLNIEFACFDDSQKVNAGVWSEDSKPYDCMTPYNGDKQAATRRAIVRAATEIGKSNHGDK